MEDKGYILKIDIRQFFQSVKTDELRTIRDQIVEEVKRRDREERKNMPPVKPEYKFWSGKVVRRRGNALSRYSFLIEPSKDIDIPKDIIGNLKDTYFTMLGGVFKKATCPKVGDTVMLKYRVLKYKPLESSLRRSRIILVVPPKLAE